MPENKLKYYITADNTAFERSIKSTVATAKTGGKAIGAGLAVGVAAAATGIYGLSRAMGDAIRLANEQERAEATLGATLRATGGAAGFTKEQLIATAGALQGITTVGDETIIAGQAILSTFKNISGEGFERATVAALDMSAVLGKDLNSSMQQIGKAVNDPISGMTRLSLAGVQFTESQKEQVKILQESGDLYGAQSVILGELETKFGGAAAALRDTYGGAVDSAKNAWGDLKEQLGFAITKNDDFIAVAQRAEVVFKDWAKTIKQNRGEIAGFFNALLEGANLVVAGITKVAGAWKYLYNISDAQVKGLSFGEIFSYSPDELQQRIVGLKKYGAELNNLVSLRAKYQSQVDNNNKLLESNFGKSAKSQKIIRDARDKAQAQIDNLNISIKSLTKNEAEAAEGKEKHAKIAENLTTTEKKLTDTIGTQSDKYEKLADTLEGPWDDLYEKRAESEEAALMESYKKNEEWSAEITKLAEELEDPWADLDERRAESEEAALMQMYEASLETTTSMATMWSDFAKSAEASFADVLATGLRGEFDSIGEAWDALLEGMTNAFINAIATMVAEAAAAELGSFFSSEETSSSSDSSFDLFDWDTWFGAKGGRVPSAGYARGGVLQGGSGSRDDLFLGNVDGVNIFAKGGEYIMPPEETAKYLPMLEDMRAGRAMGYAVGGIAGAQPGGIESLIQAGKLIWPPKDGSINDGATEENSEVTALNTEATEKNDESIGAHTDATIAANDLLTDGNELADISNETTTENTEMTVGNTGALDLNTTSSNLVREGLDFVGAALGHLAGAVTTAAGAALGSSAGPVGALLGGLAGAKAGGYVKEKVGDFVAGVGNYLVGPKEADKATQKWSDLSRDQQDGIDNDLDDFFGGLDDDAFGTSSGGVVSRVFTHPRLKVPAGDDGFRALKLGEGVVDADTMQMLSDKLRSGEMDDSRKSEINITVPVYLDSKQIKKIVDKHLVDLRERGVSGRVVYAAG